MPQVMGDFVWLTSGFCVIFYDENIDQNWNMAVVNKLIVSL